jgi:hypothetical protein
MSAPPRISAGTRIPPHTIYAHLDTDLHACACCMCTLATKVYVCTLSRHPLRQYRTRMHGCADAPPTCTDANAHMKTRIQEARLCAPMRAYAHLTDRARCAHMQASIQPSMHTHVYPCIPMHTHAYPCIPMHTHAYPCTLRLTQRTCMRPSTRISPTLVAHAHRACMHTSHACVYLA